MHGVFIRGREAMDLLQVVLMLLLMLQWALPTQSLQACARGHIARRQVQVHRATAHNGRQASVIL